MTKANYIYTRRELLNILTDARKIQAEARRKRSDAGKMLTAEIIGGALDNLVALRADYYRAA